MASEYINLSTRYALCIVITAALIEWTPKRIISCNSKRLLKIACILYLSIDLLQFIVGPNLLDNYDNTGSKIDLMLNTSVLI